MSEPVRHTEIRSADHDLIAAATNGVAAHAPHISFHEREPVGFRLHSAACGELGTHQVQLRGARYGAAADPLDTLLAGVLIDGNAALTGPQESLSLGRNDGFLYPVGAAYGCEFLDPEVTHVGLPFAYAAELAGLSTADLRFVSMAPASAPLARYWASTALFLARQLRLAPELPTLVADQLTRMAAAAVLTVFPNTTMTAARTAAAGRVAPAAVRRAVAYIEAHADRPIGAPDIAASAGIGPRGLQEAFRRHLDTTPTAYLRRARLERAHRDLQDGDPLTGVTVAGIARRWGFANVSRFGAAYRAAFGCLPSQTLRR